MGNQPTKHTTAKPKKAVHWKSAEPPSPPGKPALVPGSPSSAPDIVTIRWNRPGTDGGSPILGYVVEQRRTGSPHWVRTCPSLVQQTELSLSGLEPGWRYQFRVMAENIVGRSESSELSDPLTVTLQRNAISDPRFVHELFDATAIENEKVEFRVQVVGTPAPQISWFKDGFEIYSSRRARIITEADVSVLVIHQTALTDEGEIKCAATNRAGHTVTRCHLTIDAYPKIRLPRQYEDGLLIEAEEVVRMKVGLAGRPPPSVEWNHNGEPLENDNRHEIETTDKNSTLKITSSKRSDRGEYHIRAFNKLGEDNASFLVTVTARPEPPGRVTVAISYGKTATLSWSAPDDDGGCKIGNYIVEYYRVGWDVWLKAATCRQLTATLSDLIEGSQYRFRVKAENPYGLSDPSEESDVLFVPDPRRGITDASKMQQKPATLPRKRRDHSESPLREPSSKPKKAFTPEPYGRDEIMREMSYGTPLDLGVGHGYTSASSPVPALVITEPAPLAEPESESESIGPPTNQGRVLVVNMPSSLQAMQKFSKEPSPLSLKLSDRDLSSNGNSSDQMGSGSVSGAEHKSNAQPSQKAAIHNSSEFMLVLYNEQEAKKSTRNSTFDFELDELVAPPPPLSLSAPELNVEPPPAPTLRVGVSSTELLYERAMARFYQAVAYEESENQRKEAEQEQAIRRRQAAAQEQSQEDKSNQVTTTTVSNRLADRRSSLRKRLSGDKDSIVKQSSFEQDQVLPPPPNQSQQQQLSHSTLAGDTIVEEPSHGVEQIESFTSLPIGYSEGEESVSSSMNSMIEELKRREQQQKLLEQQVLILQKRRGFMDDDETDEEPYHPGGERMRSPYQNPDPSQAIEILTKPMPLPDPNFIPKPILKRPSTEILAKAEQTANKQSNSNLQVSSPQSPKQPTPEREKTPVKMSTPSPKAEEKPQPPEPQKEPLPEEYPLSQKQPPEGQEIERAIVSEAARQRRHESRQNSIEESRAVADFYSDMVQQIESSKKPRKLPLYMSPDEVRRLNEREYSRNSSRAGSRSPLPLEDMYLLRGRTSRSPSLSTDHPVVVQRGSKPARESKILRQRSASIESDAATRPPSVARDAVGSPVQLRDEENGRVSRPMEKKRGPSGTAVRNRSRSNSAIRTGVQSSVVSKVPTAAPLPNTSARTITKQPTPEPAPEAPKSKPLNSTPEAIEPEPKVPRVLEQEELKPTISYLTDVALFVIACWLYLFKNPKLAIPVILLIMYRHIREAVKDKIPAWMRRTEVTS
uniref:Titin n=1 Tax=Anopheles minimus TaxID=112268 RepID=A0A182WJ22_9DIPT